MEEIRQHCNRLLRISIPYEAFIAALRYDDYRICHGRAGDYMNLANRSVIARLKRGESVNRRSAVGSRILRYYGERGFDPTLLDAQPESGDGQPEACPE